MGHRANLAILEHGLDGPEHRLYYSHWRARSLGCDLFWGPEHATRFVERQRSQAEGAEWLDEVWAEGGAVIDYTEFRLLWFGGERETNDIPYRRARLGMMARMWPTWEIQWAEHGIVDLALYLDVPVETVVGRWRDDPVDDLDRLLRAASPGTVESVLTVRRQGRLGALGLGNGVSTLAHQGQRFLDRLETLDLPQHPDRFHPGDPFPQGGLHVDFDARTIGWWQALPDWFAPRIRDFLPGWTVLDWYGGYERHLEAAPCLTLPEVDEPALMASVVRSLLREERSGVEIVTSILALDGETVESARGVNAFALRDDLADVPIDERREMLRRHWPHLLPG